LIDINQWHDSAGTFGRLYWTSSSAVITHHELIVYNCSKPMWLIVHLLSYSLLFSLLFSGNIEVNPGPIYRDSAIKKFILDKEIALVAIF